MIVERTFIEGLGETFKNSVHDLRPQISLEEKITPEKRLSSLNTALGTVSTLYKNNDLTGTVIALGYIIGNSSPMAIDYINRIKRHEPKYTTESVAAYLNRIENGEPKYTTEKTIIYTLCQAANDASRVCFEIINSQDLPDEAKDRRVDLSLEFIKKAIDLGSSLGDGTITLRALNNSTKINTDRAMRHYFQEDATPESKDKARKIITAQIKKIKELLNWAKQRNIVIKNPNVEFISALDDEKCKPVNNYQLSLKYLANSLNTLGVLNLLLAEMTSYPNSPIEQILEARKVLTYADQFHMRYLKDKEPDKVKEFERRKLAIHSNLGYSFIMEMFRTKNFDSVNLNELFEIMDNVRNSFITNFLKPLGALDKTKGLSSEEVNEMRSFFRMESITRSLEILGIMLLSHTNKSTTLSRAYQDLESTVYNSIVSHFNIRPDVDGSVGEFNLLTKPFYLKRTAIILKDIGEAYLKKENATTDNEDRIFFEKALETLKSMFEIKTSLIWPQI